MLKNIHARICGPQEPRWPGGTPTTDAPATPAITEEVDVVDYAAGRKTYIAQGKGCPPASASE